MRKKQWAISTGKTFFNSLAQIMLQENWVTGVLFLAGIFCGGVLMGIAASVAVISGNLTAVVLKYPRAEITKGLYGFSAALVGVAMGLFYQPSIVLWVVIIAGAALAAIIQRYFIAHDLPGFTFPFIVVTWFLLFILPALPQMLSSDNGGNLLAGGQPYLTIIHGFGQIIFQDKAVAGCLFITGMLISSRLATLFGIMGAVLSGLLAYISGADSNAVYAGLLSYNAVLCAVTFAGSKRTCIAFSFLAVILSTLIMLLMRKTQLPALTFPFVLASWLTLVVKNRTQAPADQS